MKTQEGLCKCHVIIIAYYLSSVLNSGQNVSSNLVYIAKLYKLEIILNYLCDIII